MAVGVESSSPLSSPRDVQLQNLGIAIKNSPRKIALPRGKRWGDLKSLVCPSIPEGGAFQPRRRSEYTSNSKYFVLRRDHQESIEDDDILAALRPRKPSSSAMLVMGKDSSRDYMNPAVRTHRRRRRCPPPEAADAKWGLQSDAIDSHIHKLDRSIASRHRCVLSPHGEPKAPTPLLPVPSRLPRLTTIREVSDVAGVGRVSSESRRKSLTAKGRKGEVDAGSEGGHDSDDGWLKEEDILYLPSDAELDEMPVGAALNALLNAQQRLIWGLGRVEEPWTVRYQRKQAAIRAISPHKRVALFDTNNEHSEQTTYTTARHAYLVSKIADLKRKQRMVGVRQDRQLAAVSDKIEVEKQHMLMQLFDLNREEARLRLVMRKMEDRANPGVYKASPS